MSNAIKTEYFDITCNAVTLNVKPTSISLQKEGDSEAITYTTSPSNKYPSVSYSSSNNNVATVNYAGVVYAKGICLYYRSRLTCKSQPVACFIILK